MPQPLLSIGMIVKNEERCLEKCLNALEPLRQVIPCELVIADTGSTDATIEIAKKYADKLIHFDWVNDFAKARNFVLDHCSGKWHLYIDADEYLSDGISQLTGFLTGDEENAKSFASIIIRNHSIPQMNGTYADFNSLRLFKTSPNRKFIGAIHEYVPYTNPDECYILTDVVFDHDGYTQISPKHLKEKEARNLKILEKELTENPTDLRTIIQCLEASTHNTKKREYFTNYALNFIKSTTKKDSNWGILAPLCAFRIMAYLAEDNTTLVEDFFRWSSENFGYSHYISVDAHFIYTKYLFEKQDYNATIEYGTKYFENLKKYESSKNIVSQSSFLNPVIFCNDYSQNEIKTIMGCSLIKTGNNTNALGFLESVPLTLCDDNTLILWLKTIIDSGDSNIQNKTKNSIYEILENHQTDSNYSLVYNSIKSTFFNYFSCKNDTVNDYFKSFSPATSLSYDIANAQTKQEAEKLLLRFENWEEFMPQSLKQVMLLKADIPSDFFLIKHSCINTLLNDLSVVYNELVPSLLEKYCTKEFCNDLPRSSFAFKLLSAILFENDNGTLINDTKKLILNAFIDISEQFLFFFYNPDILKEDYVVCLPDTQALAWHLVKANNFKNNSPLEYIKTLKTVLKKFPPAKEIIEFIIEEFQAKEEQRKQEQIKNASPELVAMAEQLKTMLAAFPPNSPELLAIKQSPMYKQVAFLIEN